MYVQYIVFNIQLYTIHIHIHIQISYLIKYMNFICCNNFILL